MGMRFNRETWEVIDWLRQWELPEDTYAEPGTAGRHSGEELSMERYVMFQAATQAEVKAIRQALPHALIWQKERNEGCGWWEYWTTCDGIALRIFACHEAPPSCKAIVETYEVEEKVPVAFETRTVTKERTRWECPEE